MKNYEAMRAELETFYWNGNHAAPAKAFAERCFALLDGMVTPEMSVPAQKARY